MFINKALKGFKFGNAEKEQLQPRGEEVWHNGNNGAQ